MNTGQDQAPIARASQEPSLEVMMNNGNSTRDTITDIESIIQSIEDYLNGPRPEKEERGNVEGCAAGMMAAICQVNASNFDRLQSLQRRFAAHAQQLGVNR